MRVSNAAVALAWVGLWFSGSNSRGQEQAGKPPVIPHLRLYYPFMPGEEWQATQGANNSHHLALDLQRTTGGSTATRGAPVLAAAGGRVVRAVNAYTEGKGYGRHVVVDHGNGYGTLYAHLDSIEPSILAEVQQGKAVHMAPLEQIGRAGATGHTNPPGANHIHFEVVKIRNDKNGRYAGFDHVDDADVDLMGRRMRDYRPLKDKLVLDASKLPRDLRERLTRRRAAPLQQDTVALESITFVPPKELPAQQRDDGAFVFGNYGAYITVQRHPGFPVAAYTPDGIADALIRFSWFGATKSATKVGKDGLRGVRLTGGPGGLAFVLFSHGGHVYGISNQGQENAFSRVVASVSAKQ